MDVLRSIAEAKIREGIERGVFDDLPDRGRRLVLEDLSRVPADLRGGYSVLKSAGFLPEEMELKKECLRLSDLLDACAEGPEREQLRDRLGAVRLRYRVLMERRRRTE